MCKRRLLEEQIAHRKEQDRIFAVRKQKRDAAMAALPYRLRLAAEQTYTPDNPYPIRLDVPADRPRLPDDLKRRESLWKLDALDFRRYLGEVSEEEEEARLFRLREKEARERAEAAAKQ